MKRGPPAVQSVTLTVAPPMRSPPSQFRRASWMGVRSASASSVFSQMPEAARSRLVRPVRPVRPVPGAAMVRPLLPPRSRLVSLFRSARTAGTAPDRLLLLSASPVTRPSAFVLTPCQVFSATPVVSTTSKFPVMSEAVREDDDHRKTRPPGTVDSAALSSASVTVPMVMLRPSKCEAVPCGAIVSSTLPAVCRASPNRV